MHRNLSPEYLLSILARWPPAPRYRVAFSGGLDSTVLLHLLAAARAALPGDLCAAHVNHGIHPQSGDWAGHCARVCEALGVPLAVLEVDARPVPGASPEARARRLRYEALAGCLGQDEMLLTAHTLDDQAETVLLQLFRGAGPAGLAAMPALRALGAGRHGRPLLEVPREAVRAWAAERNLSFIEDTSNQDLRFDRNFLRHEILPRLRQRWPGIAGTLARAARIQAQAAEGLAREAEADAGWSEDGTLDVASLRELPPERRGNVLRAWLRHQGLPPPGPERLGQLFREVVEARADRTPCVRWAGAEVRRYRDRLYASAPLAGRDPRRVIPWRPGEPLRLAHGLLEAEAGAGEGLRAAACTGGEVELRFREGGERLRPRPGGARRTLKALFQEAGVPPWLRDRVPLVFVEGRLAAVAGRWVDAEFAAAPGEPSWKLSWKELPVS